MANLTPLFVYKSLRRLYRKIGNTGGGGTYWKGGYGFSNGPFFFYLKIGLDIGRVFAKCLIFDEFFL